MNDLDQLPLLPRPQRVRADGGRCEARSTGGVPERLSVSALPPEGYRLTIAPSGITLDARDAAGAFHARMTLRQLARLCPDGMPCGVIEDWPDIAIRGVMLDISRDKVPRMDTLCMLVDMLAEWKVNHLQLYMEHTFAYRSHGEVWAAASPLTADEVRALDAYCRERFIELAPNQNSFGHFERWLRHSRYRPLAECPDGYHTPSGEWRENPSTLDPTNPASVALLTELYAELLPCFTSRRFNIGCDETWELGKGLSAAHIERAGLHGVYLAYLGKLKQAAAAHGRTVLYWGDMVWNHFPERLAELDRGMVHIDWGYYRAYPFAEHGEKLAAAGLPFWFAPGTSTWCTLLGCSEAAFGSNRSAARAARTHGAEGLLNTDWGDRGHWQYLPVSFSGLAAGAAMGWCERANTDEAIGAALGPHAFMDAANEAGHAALALADAWQHVMPEATQASLLDRIIRGGAGQTLAPGIVQATLDDTEAHIGAALERLAHAPMGRPDAALVVDEFANGARMAAYACQLGRAVLAGRTGTPAVRKELRRTMGDIVDEHRRLWLARNRAGGLEDSARVLREQRDGWDRD